MTQTTVIAIAGVLALVPAIFWFFLYRWLDKKEPEPPIAMITSGVLGVIATIPIFGLQYVFQNFPQWNFMQALQASIANPLTFSLIFLVFVAIIEELVKSVSTVAAVERYKLEFNQVVDGIVYAASVALGFSFAENIYYFYLAQNALGWSGDFLSVYSIRSMGTMLGHTIFTGVFGFYYAKAYLAPYVEEAMKKRKIWHDVKSNLKKASKFKTTRKAVLPKPDHDEDEEHPGIIMMEGFFIAILLHFVYNFFVKIELFGQTWTFLIVPFLFLATWGLWRLFFKPLYTRVFVLVRNRRSRS
jgi:RsiW-degrading membrane proteinase PrsW (M82 family)